MKKRTKNASCGNLLGKGWALSRSPCFFMAGSFFLQVFHISAAEKNIWRQTVKLAQRAFPCRVFPLLFKCCWEVFYYFWEIFKRVSNTPLGLPRGSLRAFSRIIQCVSAWMRHFLYISLQAAHLCFFRIYNILNANIFVKNYYQRFFH
jgi:hypothetical protein